MNNASVSPCVSSPRFQKGDVVAAVVTAKHESGLLIKTVQGGIPGVIKISSFGKTPHERKAALRRYAIGQRVEVETCTWYEQMQQLVTVLSATHKMTASSLAKASLKGASAGKAVKRLLPEGTIVLIDSANVLACAHKVTPALAPVTVLQALDDGLREAGCEGVFFMEHRTLGWAVHTYPESAEALRAFCQEKVSMVAGEADEPLLQMALLLSGSVILSNDAFRDYAEAYPEVVTSSRIHRLSVLDEATPLLSVCGIKALIPLHASREVETASDDKSPSLMPEIACIEERPKCPPPPPAVHRKQCLCELRQKAAQRDPVALEHLAACYAEGRGVPRNYRKSITLDRASIEAKKRARQCLRRAQRGNYRCYKACG